MKEHRPDHTQLRQYSLAVFIVASCFCYFFWISASRYATNNNHIGEVKTAMIAFLGGIIGYYFGSSQGGQKNADVIRNLVNPTDGTTEMKTKSPTSQPETREDKQKRLDALLLIQNPSIEQLAEIKQLEDEIKLIT